MYKRLSLVAAFSLLAATVADAQLCAGAPSFTAGKLQVGGQLVSNDDYSSYGIGLNLGTARGLYGGGQLANNDYDFVEESGMWIGASGGYQMPVSAQGFQICPVAALGFGMGPDDIGGSGTDMSVRQFSAGAIIGKVVHREGNFQIIPSGGLSIVNTKVTMENGGVSDDESDTFFSLDLGAGFLFNQVWAIHPMLSLPFGDDGRDESLSLGVSYSFGRPATSTGPRPAARPRR
jgi:hypothetical protein